MKIFDFIFKLNDLFDHKERMRFLLVVFMALFMALFQAVGIASVLPFINMIMNPNIIIENKWLSYLFQLFNFETINSFIVLSGFAVLGLLIIGNLVSAFATWLKINFVWKKNHSLSVALLKKYMSMPYAYFLNQNTADLGKNVLFEIQQLTSRLLLAVTMLITDSVQIIIILGMLLYVDFFVTLLAVVVLASMYSLIYFNFSNKLKAGGKKRLEKNMERFKSANEALGGIKDIKILGVESFFLQRFSRNSEVFSSLQSWHQSVSQIPRYIVEVVAFGGIVGLMIFLVSFNKSTQEIIPLVSLFAFAGYRLVPAFQEVFNSLATIKFNKAVLDKIHKDMIGGSVMSQDLILNHKKIIPMSFEKEIQLEDIDFSYPGSDRIILKNINLKIRKNTFVALIGATGSGKTTLVDLMLCLFIPNKGIFKVDGVPIDEKNVKNWQANVGYVPQQIYLSDDTIARNIAFGLPDEKIDRRQIEKVAKMANIHNFIKNELPNGYETFIGERGIRLSGGQKQRIGIARALYHDPQVLLLDEATSSLDNATEKEVLTAIEGIAKLKTMIVIAHRLTTVKNCDRVYVIEKGKIVDEGSYNQIVDKKSSNKNK
jgi:ATP-binding cassette, subfamily B, bacterial PglK